MIIVNFSKESSDLEETQQAKCKNSHYDDKVDLYELMVIKKGTVILSVRRVCVSEVQLSPPKQGVCC